MPNTPHQFRHVTSKNLQSRRLAVLLVGYALRAFALDFQGLWRDEVDQWRFALSRFIDIFSRFAERGWNGPLFSPVLRLWMLGTGESVYAMRYLSLLCGVMSIVFIYIVCARLFHHQAAIWAALLVAISPYMVWYAQEIKMYTWVPMLILCALYAFERATAKPAWHWWTLTLGCTCLAFYSHILAALVIPVLFIWFWLTPTRHRTAWVGGGIVFILLTIPYLPLLIWQLPLAFTARETGYPALSFIQMAMTLLTGWTSGVHMGALTGGWAPNVMIGYMGALALYAVFRSDKAQYQIPKLLVWMLLPLGMVWLISLKSPMFTDRYLIWTAPAFYILVAVGITRISEFSRIWMHVTGAVVILFAVPALYSQSALPLKPEFDEVVTYYTQYGANRDLLLFQIPYNARVFGYYAKNQIYNWKEAPFTNWQLPDGSYQVDERYVDLEMSRIVEDYDNVWLVYSEVSLWDSRELVKTWLDARWRLIDEQFFQGVTLYHYQRPDL